MNRKSAAREVALQALYAWQLSGADPLQEARSMEAFERSGYRLVRIGMLFGNLCSSHTSPELQAAATATYSWPWSNGLNGYVNLTVQHVGSSYTQLADQEAGFGTLSTSPTGNEGILRGFGAPTIQSFAYDPELPDYQVGNLRVGVEADQWEVGAFVNNLWDERAFLSLDYERGRSARIGYLTNQPRTYGVTLNYNF